MAAGKNEAVAVDPARLGGIIRKALAKEYGAKFGTTERQAEVAGITCVNGVDGQPASLIGSFGKNFCVHWIE